MFNFSDNNPTVASGDKKYKGDPYWDDFKAAMDGSGKFTTLQGDRVYGLTSKKSKYSQEYFNLYVKNRTFMDGLEARAKAAADERAAEFDKDAAQPGAGADARDYTSFSGIGAEDIRGKYDSNRKASWLQDIVDKYGADPYFKEFNDAMQAQGKSVYTVFNRAAGAPKKTAFKFDEYVNFVAGKAAEDERAARIAAANPQGGGDTGNGNNGNNGNSEDDVVQNFLDQLPGGPNDPNAPGAGGGTLDEIVNTSPPIAAPAPPITAPAPGGTTVDSGSTASSSFDALVASILNGDYGTGPVEGGGSGPTSLNALIEAVLSGDYLTGDFGGVKVDNGGVVWDADGDGIKDGPAFIPEEGTLGEIIGSNPEEGVSSTPSPGYTIDSDGNILDANGNIIGTSSEAPVTPGYTIEDNIIYDLDGNPIGTANATEIGEVIGGASDSNPVFDALTQQQIIDAENAAEAVELMDSGYGRYNAAMRKLGIVGRQGESYAPLILDQLRMAEMEAAQPQFAAFGFGQNPMLGGMPQIGVQGVQGNVGGQSSLSALSNAGLNQLQVAQQPYNRIALPETGLGGQPISQINNPTIFKASTSV